MKKVELDTIDQTLIELLAQDARISNRKIPSILGVTEGTVRGRIKRLQQDGLIAFTAITSFETEGKALLAFINIQADVERVREISQEIKDIPSINAVMITMGRFNILALCLLNEITNLVDIASTSILGIKGVRHIETSIAVKTLKYNTSIVKITSL